MEADVKHLKLVEIEHLTMEPVQRSHTRRNPLLTGFPTKICEPHLFPGLRVDFDTLS